MEVLSVIHNAFFYLCICKSVSVFIHNIISGKQWQVFGDCMTIFSTLLVLQPLEHNQ